MKDKFFVDLGEKYGCGVGIVSLSWAVQRGVTVIPKSSKAERIEENIKLVKLSDEDVKAIDHVHEKLGKLRLADAIMGGYPLFGWSKQQFGFEDDKGTWLL